MTFVPESLTQAVEDQEVLDSVRARLELALDDPSPCLAALVRRLESRGGSQWADALLERTLGRSEAVVARVAHRCDSMAEAIRNEADEDARLLLTCALAGACLIERSSLEALAESEQPGVRTLARSLSKAEVSAEDFLDLASLLSDAWCELFVRAARVLRGDQGEDAHDDWALLAERVGGYQLLEPLGRGSFGAVYRGIQPELGRHVALKLLRPEVLSSQAEQRFLEEGRILSSLSHPGIAILYQAGFHQHLGIRIPFLAMELVRGKSILRHVTDEGLDVQDRLRLFVQACDALQHAHEREVVHCDLHPGNVLVRPNGTLKLVDFGAAFAASSARSSSATESLLGALAYMSPEQARASHAEVDSRADVFGLGAILFELVSGETPHALEGLSLESALTVVSDGTPRRLRAVVNGVDPDLDAICAKALAFQAEARYASARALGEDLRRFLGGLPVEARPPGFFYALSKLARRHEREVALVCLALVAVTTLGISSAVGWRRANAQARELETAQGVTHAVVSDLIDLAADQADKLGSDWDSQEFYETWHHSLSPLVLNSPDVRAKFMELLARHALLQRQYEDADALRAEVVSILTEARQELGASAVAAERWTVELSKALVRLGDVQWDRLHSQGRAQERSESVAAAVVEVRELYRRALALDRSVAADSTDPSHLDNLVWSHLRLFDLESTCARVDAAQQHLAEAARLAEELLALNPERPHSHYAKSEVCGRLFVVALQSSDYVTARQFARAGLLHATRAFQAERDRVPFEKAHARAQNNLATLEDASKG